MNFLQEMRTSLAKKADDCTKKLGALMKEDISKLQDRFHEVAKESQLQFVRISSTAIGTIGVNEQAAIALLSDYASLNILKGHLWTHHATIIQSALAETKEKPQSTAKQFPAFWLVQPRNKYTEADTMHNFCLQRFIDHIKTLIKASEHPDINPDGRLQAIFNLLEQYGLYASSDNSLLYIDC